MTQPRRAIRLGEIQTKPKSHRQVPLRLYISTVIFFVVLSFLQFAAIISILSLMFRNPQPAEEVVVTKIVTATPVMIITSTPEPISTSTSTPNIISQPITTTMFGWFDSSYNDYSFFYDNSVIAGQLYALCWSGRYIDGNGLSLPVQQANISNGACILAEAKPVNDKQYKLGFISQATRHALLGERSDWQILELGVYELPNSNQKLPYPVLKPAVGE